jgi:hypothetical protein
MSFEHRRRRSRRSVGTTLVTTAVISYGAYRLAGWLWNADDEEEDTNNSNNNSNNNNNNNNNNNADDSVSWGNMFFSTPQSQQPQQSRTIDRRTQWKLRRQRIVKCREESIKACQTCWPALQQLIMNETNTSSVTRKLKDLRASQDSHSDDLWKEIYAQTVTRLLSTVYAHTLLFLMTTLQIHHIGGRMFRKEEIGQDQSMLIESHQYMLQQGLPLLIPIIRRTVQQLVGDWEAKTTLTQTQVYNLLQKSRHQLEYGSNSKYSRNWIRFVLPDVTVDQVWDVATSPIWEDAQDQILQEAMTVAYSITGREEEIPAAKHMAPIKKACQKIAIEENYQMWIALPTMLELGDVSFQ